MKESTLLSLLIFTILNSPSCNAKNIENIQKSSKYIRQAVNDPINPPTGSISFSFRDALIGEPILAIAEFSEDVKPLSSDDFYISGASLKKFDMVTPKLYRLILMPSESSNSINIYLNRDLVVDRDGNSLDRDINSSASIAKAPWASTLRRYRGTIEAILSYKNSNGEKMSIPFIWVRSGSYVMGCSGFDEKHCNIDETPHRVTLTKGFWLGRTEVTQWQWYVVMQSNPSFFNSDIKKEQEKLPVENVSYDEVKLFTKKLLTGYNSKADLPTEAEWEYAMRSSLAQQQHIMITQMIL